MIGAEGAFLSLCFLSSLFSSLIFGNERKLLFKLSIIRHYLSAFT